jgi:RND superfamily putative drug exporter
MGFAISVGIAISAIVMAMFLTPALTALTGRAAWWPGHGDVARHDSAEADDRRETVNSSV